METTHDLYNQSIGVLTVATNLYLNYWKSMVLSADKVTRVQDAVTFFVFTDAPGDAMDFGAKLQNVKVRAFEIAPYSWPDATLLRYQIFSSNIKELNSEILMHLDADMLFVSSPWQRIKTNLEKGNVCLVEHPGFWRPKGIQRLMVYLNNPRIAYRDLRTIISQGAIGAWEKNSNSISYVKRSLRVKYFCGGTWFGFRNSIVDLVESLTSNVQQDSLKMVTAIWHDESHLNKWASTNSFCIENPELCFDETYPHLRKLTPSIVAVRKIEKTR